MQNEALINFYHGLMSAKTSQIDSLDTRKLLIKERISLAENEATLFERDIEQTQKETDELFGKLLEDYQGGNVIINALKDKQKNMQNLLSVEEDQLNKRNKEVCKL